MIPVVTDTAIAALPENHASDPPRKAAPSVDKFSDHLHKAKPNKSKPSQAEHGKRSIHQRSAPVRAQAKQESENCCQKVEQGAREADAKKSDIAAEKDAGAESANEQEKASAEDPGAALAANNASPVAILPAPIASPESQLESATVHECGFQNSEMATPLPKLAEDKGKVAEDATTFNQVAIPAQADPKPQDEVALPGASVEDGPVETQLFSAGFGGDPVSEAATKSGAPLPIEAAPPPTSDSNAAFQSVALPAVAESDVAEATVDQTKARDGKQSKNGATATFANYLFGEGMTRTAIAPVADAKIGPSSDASAGAVDDAEKQADKARDEAHGKEEASGRVDSPTLLTPADAAQAAASTLPLSLKRHLEAHSTGARGATAAPVVNDTQHARLLQRVQRAFRAAEERGGEIQIRLSPPELGSMKLELSLASGVLTAKLEVETQRAQTILLESLPTLRERLAEQGIRVEKFDVNLPQRDSSGQQPQQQHQHSQTERQARSAASPSRQAREAPATENRTPQRLTADASRLNVIV